MQVSPHGLPVVHRLQQTLPVDDVAGVHATGALKANIKNIRVISTFVIFLICIQSPFYIS